MGMSQPSDVMRRRWALRVRTPTGQDDWLIMEVPPGTGLVYVSIGGMSPVVYEPEQLARLRAMGLQAIATALWDRGCW